MDATQFKVGNDASGRVMCIYGTDDKNKGIPIKTETAAQKNNDGLVALFYQSSCASEGQED